LVFRFGQIFFFGPAPALISSVLPEIVRFGFQVFSGFFRNFRSDLFGSVRFCSGLFGRRRPDPVRFGLVATHPEGRGLRPATIELPLIACSDRSILFGPVRSCSARGRSMRTGAGRISLLRQGGGTDNNLAAGNWSVLSRTAAQRQTDRADSINML